MIIINANQTVSYGHVLARRIRSAVNQIPESDRPLVAQAIRDGVSICSLMGSSFSPEAREYAMALLSGQKPQPLGHNRRNHR